MGWLFQAHVREGKGKRCGPPTCVRLAVPAAALYIISTWREEKRGEMEGDDHRFLCVADLLTDLHLATSLLLFTPCLPASLSVQYAVMSDLPPPPTHQPEMLQTMFKLLRDLKHQGPDRYSRLVVDQLSYGCAVPNPNSMRP